LESKMKMKLAIPILSLAQILSFAPAPARDPGAPRNSPVPQASAPAPQCSTMGTRELTITCTYTSGSPTGAAGRSAPRIAILRAALSFNTTDEGQMTVELTFSNESGKKIAEHRTVYLEINDEMGQNHVRRPLPHVDFTRLEPGQPAKFEDKFLTPVYSAGTYVISLWIPSTDPASKFDPVHNLLLNSIGVADSAAGLNRIAKFTTAGPGRRGSPAKQDP
jgi:hypothetical protein